MHAWDKQEAESQEAYKAFRVFLEMGRERNLDTAYRSTRAQGGNPPASTGPDRIRAPGSWKGWYKRWTWKARADAFDARNDAVSQQAHEAVLAAVASDRAAMILEQEKREHALAGMLFAKMKEMMEVGLVRRKVVTDARGTHTVIEPVKWGFSTVARMADVFARLGRGSLNMPLKVDATAGEEAPYFTTSGQMENALQEGQAPPMPADTVARPPMASAASARAAGMVQPRRPPAPGRPSAVKAGPCFGRNLARRRRRRPREVTER